MCAQLSERTPDILDQSFEQLAQQGDFEINHRTEKDRVWKTGDFGFLMRRLSKFMDIVLYTTAIPFHVEWVRGRRKVSDASHLAAYYKCFHQLMDLYWDKQAYSPDFALFFKCFQSHPNIGYCLFKERRWLLEDGLCEADVFNNFVLYLRQQALVHNTKKRMSDWTAVLKDEEKSIRRTVMKLEQFSKVLAVRVDMGYLTVASGKSDMRVRTAWEEGDASAWSAKDDANNEQAKPPESKARIDAEAALQDRARFFANQRGAGKELFQHLVGYITKLERSDDGPYHFHCIFFFDGQKVQSVKYWARKIREYWLYVTEGRGYVHNCHINPKKKELEEQGRWVIGKIRGRDTVKLRKLADYVGWYFTKDQQRARMKPKVRSRLLTEGMIKKKRRHMNGRLSKKR